MFIPVEALVWIRSIAIVLLIVAHALRHVHTIEPVAAPPSELVQPPAPNLALTPEVIETLRALLAQPTVVEEGPVQRAFLEADHEGRVTDEPATNYDGEREKGNFERVRRYVADHPDAKVRDVAKSLAISVSTANKWMTCVRGERLQSK